MIIEYLGITLLSYISGSIPFGLLLTKLFSNIDIRKIGSGNIGATNVLRTGNKYLAAATLILDIIKGFIPVVITQYYYPEILYLICIIVFLGHLYPIWLKFKGGKGVATYLGIITGLSLQLSFLFIATWIVVSLIFKYSSLSSIFGSLTVFIINFLRETFISTNISLMETTRVHNSIILFVFFILIIFTHRRNILNLKNKTEPKIKI